MTERFDADYNVVVIGGGISGLSAALQAAKNGLSCALLEKEPQTGGSSAFAEGHAAFESDEQEKRGIHVGKVEAYERYLDYSHWRADPAIVSRFVENAATSIVKLREELGVVYRDVQITAPDQPGELRTWHLPEGEIAHVIELQEAEARRRGVDIFLGTPASTSSWRTVRSRASWPRTPTGRTSGSAPRPSSSGPAATRQTRKCSTSTPSTASAQR